MPDKKLTDSEIVKALNECLSFEMVETMTDLKLDDIVALINRLQAENERLNVVHYCIDRAILGNQEFAIADEYLIAYQNALKHLYNNINLKAEAYKEFAERLKIFVIPQKADGYTREIVLKRDIDNLLKELVGEDK